MQSSLSHKLLCNIYFEVVRYSIIHRLSLFFFLRSLKWGLLKYLSLAVQYKIFFITTNMPDSPSMTIFTNSLKKTPRFGKAFYIYLRCMSMASNGINFSLFSLYLNLSAYFMELIMSVDSIEN